jgi:hypothetical protein
MRIFFSPNLHLVRLPNGPFQGQPPLAVLPAWTAPVHMLIETLDYTKAYRDQHTFLGRVVVVQKFNRALTREIEVGGERLAVTLSEQGLLFRVVGSRKPPYEMTWVACLSACIQGREHPPSEAEIADALKALRAGAKERPAAAPAHAEPAPTPPTPEHTPVEHHSPTHHAAHESTPAPHQSPPTEPQASHHEASHSHHHQ